MNPWSELKALYTVFWKEHNTKQKPLHITKKMDPMMKKLDKTASGDVPALYWTVRNSSNNSTHFVGLFIDPETGFVTMWCSDKPYADSQKTKESFCNFWMQKNSKGGKFLCKHCCHVIENENITSDQKVQKKIEQKLGISKKLVANGSARERFESAVLRQRDTFAYGMYGCGKTHQAIQTLKKIPDLRIFTFHITSGMKDEDLLVKYRPNAQAPNHEPDAAAAAKMAETKHAGGITGFFQAIISLLAKFLPNIGRPGWVMTPGELVVAFKTARDGDQKVAILLEELTRSDKSLRRLLIKAMDKQNGYHTLHNFYASGEDEFITVPADKLFFVATGNQSGKDTEQLDDALASRFASTIHFTYDVEIEMTELLKYVSRQDADEMMRVAQAIRTQHLAGNLPRPLDTRSLIEWAKMMHDGESFKQAALITWFDRLPEITETGTPELGQQDAIMEILEGKP